MSISMNGKEALRLSMKNKLRSWLPSTKLDVTAASRLAKDDFVPVHSEVITKVNPGSSVFTMGSCFARNIEHRLKRNGFHLPTEQFTLEGSYYKSESNVLSHRGALNKYNPHSMLMEVKRALDLMPEPENNGFIPFGDLFYDPQTSAIKENTVATLRDIRGKIKAVTREIVNADLAVFTLGLTETWYDTHTGLSLNQTPNPILLRSFPDRFEFRNAGFQDCYQSIAELVEITKASAPNIRVILTVSPVPLGVTFSGWDVIRANTYSKGTLVSVANAVTEAYDFVDYFPSFEMATHTNRKVAYAEDFVHVRNETVAQIIDIFVAEFIAEAAAV